MNSRYPVPNGFRPLLEALAREVLRGQPTDIYSFSALFFEILLDMRNVSGENPIESSEIYEKFKYRLFSEACEANLVKPGVLSALSRTAKNVSREAASRGSDGKQEFESDVNFNDSDLNQAATKIQATFRGYKVRQQKPDKNTAQDDNVHHHAATKIQANVRGYLTRKHYKATKTPPSSPVKRPTTLQDESIAATKIQANIRGYLTRKQLQEQGITRRSPTSPMSPKSIGSDGSPRTPEEETAAAKIQAGVRGYLTRKQLTAQGVPVHSPTHRSHSLSHKKAQSVQSPKDLSPQDEAATKIQAGIRGYLTRKQLEQQGLRKRSKDSQRINSAKGEVRRSTIAHSDEAASKIQAGIRGYLTRKHMREQGLPVRMMSAGSSPTSPSKQRMYPYDDNDQNMSPDEAQAATKIQAAFRGHMVRQQVARGRDTEADAGAF